MNTIDLLQNHRTIRKYQDKVIPQELLNRILECGIRASNTGNMQLYSIVVTREQPLLGELCKLHYGQGSTAPVMLTVCVDVNRYHHWCRLRGCDEPYGNLLWFLSGMVDASLAAQNICVAAEAEGLGFCYLGTVLYNAKSISELLQLPHGVVPVITLAMGYPAEEQHLSERLPLEGVVHYETYHDYDDAAIEEVHRVRETFPFNVEMVKQNGVRNLAELFTAIRYPRKDSEAISQSLEQYLREQGLL